MLSNVAQPIRKQHQPDVPRFISPTNKKQSKNNVKNNFFLNSPTTYYTIYIPHMFQKMQAFITSAFMYEPPVRRYNDIHTKVIKEIKAGKSGACVYELENNCILKTYLPRDHNEYFKTGTAQVKRDKYVKHKYEYIRSIRDIVMANILPDSMSPKVYDYGFVKTGKGLQPFIIMEKVRGVDLFTYMPTGTDRDIRILSNIVGAVRQFNKCIRSYNPAVIPCHKDLHPHNIMVNPYNNEVKLIDFDLSTCPYDLLRTNDSTHRYTNPLLDKLIGNSIQVTKAYTHEHLNNTPKHIKEDADLYQLYSVFYYFSHHNKRLPKLVDAVCGTSNKSEFLDTSERLLKLEKRVLKL